MVKFKDLKYRLDVLVYILKDDLDKQLEEDRLENEKKKGQLEKPKKRPPAEEESPPESSKKPRYKEEISLPSSTTPVRIPASQKGKNVAEADPEYSVKEELGLYRYRGKQVRVSVNEKTPLQQKANKRRVAGVRIQNPVPELDMPEIMKNHITQIGGDNIKLVIQKYLCRSDVLRNNHRFSIPVAKVKQQFLTEEEDEFFKQRDVKGKKKEIEVTLTEPTVCDVTVVNFKRWEMEKNNGGKTSSSYVLTHTWMKVVERNGLREGDLVQLWSFRVGPQLNFAMVLVERAKQNDDNDGEEESEI